MQTFVASWLHCLKHYVQMSGFRSSPSNLPYNHACIVLTLLAYFFVGVLLLSDQRSLISIIVQIIIEILILSAISFIILKFIKKPERLSQTLSALIGVNLIISIVSLAVMSVLPEIKQGEPIDPLVLQVNLVILIWNLAVISLIFKRAFDIRTIVAGFIAFNYFLLYELILFNVFQ